nr:ribonuclease H-like domain-containing protein [Tanacetum cinerariifolium]
MVALKGKLRMLHMGDQSADEYFSKIDSLVTLLSDLGSDVSEDDVVTYAINGLSNKYGSLAQIIAHKDPFPDLATMRSMISTEEMRLRSKSLIQPTNMTASAPQVLLATSNIPHGGDNRNTRNRDNRNTRNRDNRKPNTSTEVCRNLVVVSVVGEIVVDLYMTLIVAQIVAQLLQLLQAQQSLLAQYGLNSLSGQRQPLHNSVPGPRSSAPPGFTSTKHQQAQHAFSPQQQALFASTVQSSGIASQPNAYGQETYLPQALNTMTLQEPTDLNWNMDTGASSHLNSSTNNLSTIFNSCMYPSVLVGDGKSIPVTNTGHSTLLRQFVRGTIKFDEFGFSVKDFWTHQIILRCDSTSDLCPVTSPSYPKAFLHNADGSLNRYKARLVANGSSQLAEFSMTDLGPLNYFLGVSVTRDTSGVFLSQQKYATEYADIFTKRLPTALFDEFRSSLSVRSSPAQTAGGC